MDCELSIASQVQSEFLPHSFPHIAGLEILGKVQQGRFIGGDPAPDGGAYAKSAHASGALPSHK